MATVAKRDAVLRRRLIGFPSHGVCIDRSEVCWRSGILAKYQLAATVETVAFGAAEGDNLVKRWRSIHRKSAAEFDLAHDGFHGVEFVVVVGLVTAAAGELPTGLADCNTDRAWPAHGDADWRAVHVVVMLWSAERCAG